MEFGWQDLAALGIVLAAAGYMARIAWNAVTRKRGSGCGSGCGSCSAQTSSQSGMRDPKPEQIVSISMIGPIRPISERENLQHLEIDRSAVIVESLKKDLPLPSLADVVGPQHDDFDLIVLEKLEFIDHSPGNHGKVGGRVQQCRKR